LHLGAAARLEEFALEFKRLRLGEPRVSENPVDVRRSTQRLVSRLRARSRRDDQPKSRLPQRP
jgi:hypothetical protein